MTGVDETTSPQDILKVRDRAKKKKPDFVRHESWRYKRLKKNWRRPRGLDNKMRRRIKGWPPTVRVGYKGPKIARGLHPSGYREVMVHNLKDLTGLDPNVEAARIAHTVGKRKRVEIIVEAKRQNVVILNIKGLTELTEKKQPELSQDESPLKKEVAIMKETKKKGAEKP